MQSLRERSAKAKQTTKTMAGTSNSGTKQSISAAGVATRLVGSILKQRNAGQCQRLWFGVPLAEQPNQELDRGHRVPSLLASLRRSLDESDALRSEGIFRGEEAGVHAHAVPALIARLRVHQPSTSQSRQMPAFKVS